MTIFSYGFKDYGSKYEVMLYCPYLAAVLVNCVTGVQNANTRIAFLSENALTLDVTEIHPMT